MNDKEFQSLNFFKLKYRSDDQIIQRFFRIGSPKKLGPPSLIFWNLNTFRKLLLNHAECIEIE